MVAKGKVSVERGGRVVEIREEGDGWPDKGGRGGMNGRKGPAGSATKSKSKKRKKKKMSRRRIVGVCCWLLAGVSPVFTCRCRHYTLTGTGVPVPVSRFYYKVTHPGISGINYTLQHLINPDLAIPSKDFGSFGSFGPLGGGRPGDCPYNRTSQQILLLVFPIPVHNRTSTPTVNQAAATWSAWMEMTTWPP
jgi:hypothetical protein